jgi:hypothetical protein
MWILYEQAVMNPRKPIEQTYTRSSTWPTEQQMLDHIREELRYIRKRLDDHIDDESAVLTKIVEDIATHRAKVAGIAFLVSVVIAAAVTWIFNQA